MGTVWQDVKRSLPIDAHYCDALDFLHTWGPDWDAFEVRQVPSASCDEASVRVGQGSPTEGLAVEQLSSRLWGCAPAAPECFGAIPTKVRQIVEASRYGYQKNVPLTVLLH